jgi:hypothetical protein
MFKLTRFLYNEEEVKLSFIASILKKRDIIESYYWFSELYYSKVDVCDIIWEIYFDYYALINPKLESYIIKKINDWKQINEIDNLLYIVKNLHIAKYDSRVFLLRQTSISENLCQVNMYVGFSYKITKIYDKKYHSLLMSLKKCEWIDICYYLNKLFKSKNRQEYYKIYQTLFDYLLSDSPELRKQFDDLWKARIDERDYHFTLKMICKLLMKTNHISFKSVYVSPLKEDINEIKSLEIPVTPSYKTLPNRRWFKIDENIGSFDLNRFGIVNYKSENYNWEYYASFTPLWKERIDAFKATPNHENRSIEFEDDDSLEEFYEKFGYELDEQSKEVQDYSILSIEKKNWIDWFKYIEWVKDDDNINIGLDIRFDDLPDDFKLK